MELSTNHGENGGENADFLGLGGDVVVPVVVGGEKVEHELFDIVSKFEALDIFRNDRSLTMRFITAYC